MESHQSLEKPQETKRNIDIKQAALRVMRTSVLIEDKACENLHVAIRLRPLNRKETLYKQTYEVWGIIPPKKLLDKKRGIAYEYSTMSRLILRYGFFAD